MSNNNKPSERELDIMEVLWKLGHATIGEVHGELVDAGEVVAYTTVQTVLNRLETKRLVSRRKSGAAYHYYPVQKRGQVLGDTIRRLTDRFFSDSAENLAVHLVEEKLDDVQLDRLYKLIQDKRGERKP